MYKCNEILIGIQMDFYCIKLYKIDIKNKFLRKAKKRF